MGRETKKMSPLQIKARMRGEKRRQAKILAYKLAAGMTIQNEKLVMRAISEGLSGNKKRFSSLWRAANTGMDEHVSTASVYFMLKGIGSVHKSKVQKLWLIRKMITISMMRMPTKMTGFSTTHGSAQHPTAKGVEFFDRRGKSHGYWDRFRREDALRSGESSSSMGFDRLDDVASEATRHSLSFGIAPASAGNVFTMPGITSAQETQQSQQREAMKSSAQLFSAPISSTPSQMMDDDWEPDRSRPMSPRRY